MRSISGSVCKSLVLACAFGALVACSGDSQPADQDGSAPNAGSGGATVGNKGPAATGGRGAMQASGGSGGAKQASGGSSGAGGGGAGSSGIDAGRTDAAGDGGALDAGTADGGMPSTLSQGLVGWAAVEGDGDDTTTGGFGGAEVTPSNAQELIDAAKSADALIIHIHGSFTVPVLDVSSNKTLVGTDATATIEGGIRIRGKKDALVHNVVIQNLRVHASTTGVDGDGVQIHYAHHVWVDHCEVWDAADGNLDIVHMSNWVTVSWTKFHYTSAAPDQNHRFCNLVGHSDDNAAEDTDRLKVTFHHDWWADGVVERMPRVRFGQVHVFNNYYSAHGNSYAVGAAIQSRVRVENNVFDGVTDPHKFYLTSGETRSAEMFAAGNLYPNSTGKQDNDGSAFTPPYPYDLDPASGVAAIVMANAGPH